jgi:hypothetical protein
MKPGPTGKPSSLILIMIKNAGRRPDHHGGHRGGRRTRSDDFGKCDPDRVDRFETSAHVGPVENPDREWRSPGTSAARRDSIRAQLQMFTLWIAWTSQAHFLLYVATACFLAMVLGITLSLPLLLGGVILMLLAIVLELLDLRKAHAKIELESKDL